MQPYTRPEGGKMGYRESYDKARKQVDESKAVWVPETKVVFIPPNFLVWLGGDVSILCTMRPYSTRDLARYITTQKVPNEVSLEAATPEEVYEHRDDLLMSVGEIIKELSEPYLTRFSAAMLVIS